RAGIGHLAGHSAAAAIGDIAADVGLAPVAGVAVAVGESGVAGARAAQPLGAHRHGVHRLAGHAAAAAIGHVPVGVGALADAAGRALAVDAAGAAMLRLHGGVDAHVVAAGVAGAAPVADHLAIEVLLAAAQALR